VEAAHLPWQHLGSLLINRGLLTVDQVKQAFEEQQLTSGSARSSSGTVG
jgi:hypothetical protein